MSVLADSAASKTPLGPNGSRLPRAKTIRYNPIRRSSRSSRAACHRRGARASATTTSRPSCQPLGGFDLHRHRRSRITDKKVIDRAEYERASQPPGRLHRRAGDGRSSTATSATTPSSGPAPASTSKRRTPTSRACSSSSTSRPMPRTRPGEAWQPELVMIYTPNLPMPDYPDERLIAVDLEAGISRIFNSDYFGESKKGGLRMWNERIHAKGGLAMHAGCKVIPTDDGEKTVLIIGLSGTGKTTTTFTARTAPSRSRTTSSPSSRRPGDRHRERLLREDVRPRSRPTSRRSTAPSSSPTPTSRTSRRPSRRPGRLLRHQLHEERARDLPDGLARHLARPARDRRR